MSGDNYIQAVLAKYAVNRAGAEAAGQTLSPVLARWGNGYLVKAEFSGSLAKGTAVSIGTDADIFLSVSSSITDTLETMYTSLYHALSAAGYPPRKQNVSVGVTVAGYSIDLVPGRRQSAQGNDHSLYKNKSRSWTLTNVAKHIAYVSTSRRLEEIRAIKIWRQLHRLSFPSFFLEMAVIAALNHRPVGALASNVLVALEYLESSIERVRFIDPANTNNVISEDCTSGEKAAIARTAKSSRTQSSWAQILW